MPDIPNIFGEIIFEKLETLQRMYGLINLFWYPAILQFLMTAAIYFFIAYKELKIAQTAQINQLF